VAWSSENDTGMSPGCGAAGAADEAALDGAWPTAGAWPIAGGGAWPMAGA
jgi:hypothetical protein